MRLWAFLTIFIIISAFCAHAEAPPDLVIAQADSEPINGEEDGDGDDWGNSDDWGDASGGFEEIQVTIEPPPKIEDTPWDAGGFFRQELAYSLFANDDSVGFSRENSQLVKIRSSVFGFMEYQWGRSWKAKISAKAFYDDAYHQQDRDRFSQETLNAYETEAELRDTFIEGELISNLWLKFGRQIIAWGESEGTQIVDLANPRDSRELGQVNIEDARLPVTATKLSWVYQQWEINAVAIHEIRPNKQATEGSDFDPYIALRNLPNVDVAQAEVPESDGRHTELLVRIFRSFNGGDLSLIYADVFEDSPYLKRRFLPNGTVQFTPHYKRIQSVGASASRVWNSFLFRAETAFKEGRAFAVSQEALAKDPSLRNWDEKNSIEILGGVDYTGIHHLDLTLEVSATQIEDYDSTLQDEEQVVTTAFILRHDSLSETLNTQFTWFNIASGNGDVYRLDIEYDWVDDISVSGGLIFYEAAEKTDFLYAYRNNDRLFGAFQWSF